VCVCVGGGGGGRDHLGPKGFVCLGTLLEVISERRTRSSGEVGEEQGYTEGDLKSHALTNHNHRRECSRTREKERNHKAKNKATKKEASARRR
jgi:hypothetical protein